MICGFVCILLYILKSCSFVVDVMSKIITEATFIGPADSLVKKTQLFFPRKLNLFTFLVVNINLCIPC